MIRPIILGVLLCGLGIPTWSEEATPAAPEEILEQARSLAANNRYTEALAALEPLIREDLSGETSWEIAAEAGRAAFHQGKYRRADEILRRVVQARPVVIESALYLQATSYLLGDHRQAFSIFEAVLQSKAQDLYLAITLPGEKRFLAEPEVQRLLKRYAQPLVIRPDLATAQGARLGQGRPQIAQRRGIEPSGGGSALMARAGPLVTWILSFDNQEQLVEVVLDADHLRRYTPFTLDLSEGISWTSTPIVCIGSLGTPQRSSATDDGALILTWDYPEASLDMVFSRPDANDEGAAILEMVRMYRRQS
ncbi:MAG: hypothetical protein DRJ65_13280 [Acidobacteria bacterium]|nr:MAG: hypothetical protein DRJ65_13280 [Acidobacteriota bacterium]